ncbi:methyltransferase domain-containing protein [Helicobacter winghamensis]|uniref:methyltransferase domain-containing protein n=1 Tax=Helicobacter winghamensis TaxID=157268 RepID=UPI00242A6A05|nr:methyltransferase domain-containing protein [Helicobacter winghamensis]
MHKKIKDGISKYLSPDFIQITFLQLPKAEYIEIINNTLYFIKDKVLFAIFNYNEFEKENLQLHSKKIDNPYSYCYSIWKFQTKLYASIGFENKFFIAQINNGDVKILSETIFPILEEYIIVKGSAICLFNSIERDKSCIYQINSAVNTIYENSNKIFSIAFNGQFLYANIQKQRGLSSIAIVAKQDFLGIHPYNKNILEGTYYKLIGKNNEVFIAQDGPTKIINQKKQIVFEDIKKPLGMQINSSISSKTKLGRTYTILSSWRNGKEHDKTILYILRNNYKLLFKISDETQYQDKLKWSGYHSYRSGIIPLSEELIFCNKYGVHAIVKISKSFPKNIQKGKLVYNDHKTVIILEKDENKEEIKEKNLHKNEKVFYSTNKDMTSPHKSQFYITIDVEQHVKNIPFAITGEGLQTSCGIYKIMDILEKYSLKGIFFINVYEHKNFNSVIEKIIKDIDNRGHEIALHHHPNPSSPWNKNITEYPLEEQIRILKYGKNFIEKLINKPIVSFRGGGYMVNHNTFAALESCGFKYDSSAFSLSSQQITYKSINKITQYNNLIEIPVTTNFICGYLTKIDINAQAKALDMLDMLQTHRYYGLNHIVIMLHSFSFIKWYRGNDGDKKSTLKFTGNRWAVGVQTSLIREFEIFCQKISSNDEFENKTFSSLEEKDIENALKYDKDVLPLSKINFYNKDFCPICCKEVQFLPYRNRKNALCSSCKSLERMRLKYLYLTRVLKLHEIPSQNILHIGPAMCVYNQLKQLNHHNYITSDPFSEAIYKYPLENIPFENGYFNIIICIAVLMHVLDDKKCIDEMIRLLSTDGKLILWLGSLDNATTQERYDRNQFHRMKAVDFSYPKDLKGGTTFEMEDGNLGFNPRFSTRTYGRDIISYFENKGLIVEIVYANKFAGYKKYGLSPKENLLIVRKMNNESF